MENRMAETRDRILYFYDMDINKATQVFSPRNDTYVFPDEAIVRVSMGRDTARSSIMSELLWMDEVKRLGKTVCEPLPSLRNNFFEQFEIEGVRYSAAKFRKARGSMITPGELDGWTVMLVGELLGRIHRASYEAAQSGMRYKRPRWNELDIFDIDLAVDILSPEVMARMRGTLEGISGLREDPGSFGMVHGDFGNNNYYKEENNIWVFDFDDCHYNFYMYDIAAAMVSWLSMPGLQPGARRREVFSSRRMLEDFRAGYERNMKLLEGQWDKIELFMRFRLVAEMMYLVLFLRSGKRDGEGLADVSVALTVLSSAFRADDVFGSLDRIADYFEKTAVKQGDKKGAKELQILDLGGGDALLVGRVSYDTAPVLEEYIDGLMAKKPGGLSLNFGGIKFLSSAGIRVLLKAYKALGGSFRLTNVGSAVAEVLDTVGMAEYLIGE